VPSLSALRPRVFSSRELPLTATTFPIFAIHGSEPSDENTTSIFVPLEVQTTIVELDRQTSQVHDATALLTSNIIPVAFRLLTDVSEVDCIALDGVSVSQDIYQENCLSPADTIAGDLDLLGDAQSVQVSEDLLKPIDGPRKISGMNYADRYWTTETLPRTSSNGNQARTSRTTIRPKDPISDKTPRKERTHSPSRFWDLIFALLQPPIGLDVQDSLQLPHKLYAYQTTGVRFLASNEHALLADDMGTGKTVMTIVALRILMQKNAIKRALILCPPSILYEWRRHLELWAPELLTCFVRGSTFERSYLWGAPAQVYVTTYDTLRNDVEKFLIRQGRGSLFDLVVIDEAHHIKNPDTKRAKAIRKLSPRYRWALTGTPIQNKIEDIAALFQFIYPGLISSFDLHPDRIKKKVDPHFLRRRKQDVLKDLPPKIKQDIWLEMDDEQREEYERVERQVQTEIAEMGANVTRQHIFARMQLLKQICNFASNRGTSPKLDMLKEQIEDIVESGHKVIVFSQYIGQGIDKIAAGLRAYGVGKIVGGQSDLTRRQEIERFKYSADTPILLVSLKSGGEGLNLTEASYVVHFDHWWNPAVMWQAEDRVHRKGQERNVNIYSYWMSDTIDARIHQVLRDKGLLFENIVDGLAESTIEEHITMEDLLAMIGVEKPTPKQPKYDPQRWAHLTPPQIQQQLLEISPSEFEGLVERLMHYLGYPNVKVTKRTGDGGIDVLSTRFTEHGVERVAVQCKRYRGPVGVNVAREFVGAIQDDESIVKGYLVTTSDFTPECIAYCLRHQIQLISGIQMADYVQRFGLEV
jgi:superfamily II DNA or RNA helicase